MEGVEGCFDEWFVVGGGGGGKEPLDNGSSGCRQRWLVVPPAKEEGAGGGLEHGRIRILRGVELLGHRSGGAHNVNAIFREFSFRTFPS